MPLLFLDVFFPSSVTDFYVLIFVLRLQEVMTLRRSIASSVIWYTNRPLCLLVALKNIRFVPFVFVQFWLF